MRISFTPLLLACSVLLASQAHATTYNMGSLSGSSNAANFIGAGEANQGPFTESVLFNVSSSLVKPQSYVSFSIGSSADITDENIAIYQVLGLSKTKLVATGISSASFQSTPNTEYDVVFTGIGADTQNHFTAQARVSAVPEPESTALFTAGIVVLGLVIAGKKVRASSYMK